MLGKLKRSEKPKVLIMSLDSSNKRTLKKMETI
jgi:hypothetical protein